VRIAFYPNPHDFVAPPDQDALLGRTDLACADADPAVFEVDADERMTAVQRRIVEAKAICATCPVLRVCANLAIADDTDMWMVRGGLSPQERVELRRRLSLGAA
jgi:WhiB family redox-sensing transcriptional regulator